MRKLCWFTLGAVAGIATGLLLLTGNWLCMLASAFMGIGLLFSLLPLHSKGVRICGCVLIGCAVGMFWMFLCIRLRVEPAKNLDGRVEQLHITVTDYSSTRENGTSGEGQFVFNGEKYALSFSVSETVDLKPGDAITGWFELRYVGYGSGESFAYHQGNKVMLVGNAQGDCTVYLTDAGGRLFSAVALRQNIKALIEQLFPEDTAAFAVALLLGDSSDLSSEVDNALQNSGIRHIIAVSGLHVSMLFGFVHFLTGKRKWLSLVVGVPALFAFAAVAGFTPSVLRACIMQTVILISYLSMREYDSLTALALAVLILLGIDPFTLGSISFQLSALCVLGIILFGEKIFQYLMGLPKIKDLKPGSISGKICRAVFVSVSISISAMIFTLPVSSYYFGIISTVSVLTNLLTLWVVTYIFCGLLVTCALGAVCAPFGMILAQIISVLIRYVIWVAEAFSKLPYASLGIHNIFILIWMVAAYGILIVHLLMKRKGFLLTGICLLATLCVALGLTALSSRTSHFQMTVLDVGQGQCVIFQSKDQCYVVDCGGDSGAVVADMAAHTLKNQGINRIDGIILTHFDLDHGGGVRDLMAQIDTTWLYLPDAEPDAPLRMELEQSAGEKIQWVRNTKYISFGNAVLTIYPADYGKIANESSMCILFQSGKYDILITGDKNQEEERLLLQDVALPDIEILIVGHHGSAGSTSMELLDAIRPGLAIISADGNHKYGHPSVATLKRLEMYGCKVLRTDLQGTIVLRG